MTRDEAEPNDSLLRVIDGGYCVGCGACASVDSSIKMRLNALGVYQPELDQRGGSVVGGADPSVVCPFSGSGPNEDEIAEELFGEHTERDNKIGHYVSTYAGYVREDDYREQGSSGGMGSWLLDELMGRGLIDKVVHVERSMPTPDAPQLFKFGVSGNSEELRRKSKSHYYPVELSGVIDYVRDNPGRYAFVGVPCYVKAVRLLARHDSVVRDRIQYTIGLVCGHMKSTRFAGMFAWQLGIHPDEMTEIDFRVKMPDENANHYAVQVRGDRGGEPLEGLRRNKEFFGYLWGHGFFKNMACEYCDDVVAETADVTIGDAWLPQYVGDSDGTNVIVTRRPDLDEIIRQAGDEGRLALDRLTPGDVAKSQDAGFRHRREGLSYRLWLKDNKRQWRPPKRVAAKKNATSRRYRKIFEHRLKLAEASHQAFREALRRKDYDHFERQMRPLIRRYERVRNPLARRLLARGKRLAKRSLKLLGGKR